MSATRRNLLLIGLMGGLGLLAAFWPAFETAWVGLFGAYLGVALFDALAVRRQRGLRLERQVPGSLPVGVWHTVQLRLHNTGTVPLDVAVFDHYPVQADLRGLPRDLRVPRGGWVQCEYGIRPTRRGREHFVGTQVRHRSPLGLWTHNRWLESSQEVHVYPDFAAIAHYALLATDNRLSQIGVRKRPRRGAGMDFHQLREWRDGDSPQQVDWKATARTRKLISREYQDERDQEVVFLVDCGRRMLARDGELSHFDHSLNALLLLSYVAMRQGDSVGVLTFSGNHRWLAPAKGRGLTNRLLNGLFDLEPGPGNPDYSKAASDLMVRQRKRALVVLITNLRDEDHADLLPALDLLRRRHLVVLASLREQALEDAASGPSDDFESALTLASANEYLAGRESGLRALRARGVSCVDVTPQNLPVSLVNRYLDLKAVGRI
ncbi:MAG: DUF58 domain-containing protein [Gammaproteobacteria bacterium]